MHYSIWICFSFEMKKLVQRSLCFICPKYHIPYIPVSMYMWSTEGEAVVDECGIDHDAVLRSLQKVVEVTQVSMATTHAVPRTVLVQHKHLTRAEPTLQYIRFIQTHHVNKWLLWPFKYRQNWKWYPMSKKPQEFTLHHNIQRHLGQ